MINFLKNINHPRIIKLIDTFKTKEYKKFYNYEIYEYMPFTL